MMLLRLVVRFCSICRASIQIERTLSSTNSVRTIPVLLSITTQATTTDGCERNRRA
jgi:hypothetical protein